MTPRDRVLAALDQLEGDELEVLAEVADGLVRGRGCYGRLELATDRRDMAIEALEEARDGLVYAAAALVRGRRAP
jgi:hypothetical protein